MALINCPECGQQISSEAKQCIHCGCKFVYCPECQTVTLGEAQSCPKCGYAFKAEKSARFAAGAENYGGSVTKETDLIKLWQDKNPLDKKIYKSYWLVRVILAVLIVGLAVIGGIMVGKWKNISDPLDKMAGMSDLQKNVKTITAVDCILIICINVLEYARTAFVKLRCGRWLNLQDVDCVEYLSEYIKNEDGGKDYIVANTDELSLFAECAYQAEYNSARTAVILNLIIRLAGATAMAIFLGVGVMQNVEELLRAEMYSDSFKFQYIMFIVSIVSEVVGYVIAYICEKRYKAKFKAWLNENIPTFTKYI